MSALRILLEKTSSGFSAWSPDLPGCIATGDTEEDARARMDAAVRMHVEGLRKAGRPVPPGASPD